MEEGPGASVAPQWCYCHGLWHLCRRGSWDGHQIDRLQYRQMVLVCLNRVDIVVSLMLNILDPHKSAYTYIYIYVYIMIEYIHRASYTIYLQGVIPLFVLGILTPLPRLHGGATCCASLSTGLLIFMAVLLLGRPRRKVFAPCKELALERLPSARWMSCASTKRTRRLSVRACCTSVLLRRAPGSEC